MPRARFPIPQVIDPPERICVQMEIPDEQGHRMAFLGAIYTLTRWYSWDRDDDKSGKLLGDVWQPIYDLLESRIGTDMCGCDEDEEELEIMLRQNPEDSCEMQYMNKEGFWVTFFDFGLCDLFKGNIETQGILDYSETQTTITIVNNNTTVYEADPDNYPPQTDVNNQSGTDIGKLLCHALRVILTTSLETMARNKGQADAGNITLSMILGAGLALFFAPFTPLIAGGILVGFGAGWFVGIASINVASLRNQTALDKVICAIYRELVGGPLRRSEFVQAISNNPFEIGTDEYLQADIVNRMMQSPEFYLAVVAHMQANIATVGALTDPCFDCETDLECFFSHQYNQLSEHPKMLNSIMLNHSIPRG